ncbi:MAG: hypothetical protein GC160_08445 [Acidobacteria bacterium]|nr:hypothetical protein [Acidobacteriota bacterium]
MSFLNTKLTRRSILTQTFTLAALSSPALLAADLTSLRILVVDEEGKPVPRASVVIGRLKKEDSRKMKGRPLQLKTSMQGSAPLPPLEQGWYMVQVISTGYQTYGGKIELSGVEQEYTVTLKPPQKQFSVHTKDQK